MSSWPGQGVSPHCKRWCRPSPAMPSPSSGPSPAPLPGPLPPALTSSATAFTAGPSPHLWEGPSFPKTRRDSPFQMLAPSLGREGWPWKASVGVWTRVGGWPGASLPTRDSALPASNRKGKSLPVGLTLGPFLWVGNNDNTTMQRTPRCPGSPADLGPAASATPHFPSRPSSSPASPLPATYCTCCALYLECTPLPPQSDGK